MMRDPTTTPALQPLSIRAIFVESWQLYGRHWRPFLAAHALVAVPLTLLSITQAMLDARRLGELGDILAAFLILPVFLPVQLFMTAASIATIVLLAEDATAGRSLNVAAAYRLTFARLRPIARTTLSVYLTLLLCITIVAIPFVIYRVVGWFVSLPAILLERCAGRAALARSTQLVQGQRWPVLTAYFVIGVPLAVVSFSIYHGLGAQSLWPGVHGPLQHLGSLAADIMLGAPTYIVYHVLYRALRERRDLIAVGLLADCRRCKYPNLPDRRQCENCGANLS